MHVRGEHEYVDLATMFQHVYAWQHCICMRRRQQCRPPYPAERWCVKYSLGNKEITTVLYYYVPYFIFTTMSNGDKRKSTQWFSVFSDIEYSSYWTRIIVPGDSVVDRWRRPSSHVFFAKFPVISTCIDGLSLYLDDLYTSRRSIRALSYVTYRIL